MENQHKLIKGYRELSNTEIQLMNEIKEQGQELLALNLKIKNHVLNQRTESTIEGGNDEKQRLDLATPERWLQIGWTHFQEGLMATTRAVAQPTFP